MNDDALPIQIRRGKILGLEVNRSGPWRNARAAARLAFDVGGWWHNFLAQPRKPKAPNARPRYSEDIDLVQTKAEAEVLTAGRS